MEELNITYFRKLYSNNVKQLEASCKYWEEICSSVSLTDDVLGEIRTAVGLTKLLIRQKLKQFGDLVDESEHKTGEKEVTCQDLQGFWEMVYCEVDKLQNSFKKLEECQSNNWEFFPEESPVESVPASTLKKQKPSTKYHSIAARQRLAEAKLKMQALAKQNENMLVIDIKEPAKANSAINLENGNKEEKSFQTKTVEKLNQLINEEEEESIAKDERVLVLSATESNIKITDESEKTIRNSKNLSDQCLKAFNGQSERKPNKESSLKSTLKKKENSAPVLQNIRKLKENIPLQCITRSSKKKLLVAQQTALQDQNVMHTN
ncbi:disks large-associated protein 5-like isoform X1 [Stegodyphus dumicola]|uniref:disks large-associated protein 5-like isoform X1 n=1 Tax=Stegodyphus dumicola TaxID=202533 RepID=UPI0015B0FF7F|nr:disks large-associated protein 5-like isoform X1 [Stegodyphus dumicola]